MSISFPSGLLKSNVVAVACGSSETSQFTYQTTLNHNPEDSVCKATEASVIHTLYNICVVLVDVNKTIQQQPLWVCAFSNIVHSPVVAPSSYKSKETSCFAETRLFNVAPRALFLFENNMYRGVNCFMEMFAVRPSHWAAVGFIDLYNKQELSFLFFPVSCIIFIECRYVT
jgi:hypothetical protein